MKFKDERPTEPGLYWAVLKPKEMMSAEPVYIRRSGEIICTIPTSSGADAFEWGDKIEIPKVEL